MLEFKAKTEWTHKSGTHKKSGMEFDITSKLPGGPT
jgi:hypothetical protein